MHGYLVRISHYLWFPLGGWAFVFLGFCMGEWLCLVGGGDIWFMIFHIYGLVFTSISLTNTLIIRFLLDFRIVSCFGKQV